MNILEYVQAVGLSTEGLDSDGFEALDSMPLDSNCGNDCKSAIDAAITLINIIRQAFGNESAEEYNIADATLSAVLCFICG